MNETDRKLPAALRADCSRCAGLCCVAPAFYSVQGFGFDKPAHRACTYLTSNNQCAIHTERAARGFPACQPFDCFGAGQRVTQEFFHGANWRASRDVAARMFSAYTCIAALHRLMALLAIAEAYVPPPQDARLRAKRLELDELCRSDAAKRGVVDVATAGREVMALVRPSEPTHRSAFCFIPPPA
jgi:hypothetical protein